MAEYYYKDALKLGQREYRSRIGRGMSPCLPVLDDFVSGEIAAAGTDLGIVQIPADWIVGTKTRGRVNAFASNFMPLLEEGTEFAMKWEGLCKAHLSEGIREPIKAYEYMNRYYVEEGNKRVSVLKFFDAVTIPGRVIRILPERNEETELYFELVEFSRYSGINYLEFSKKGCCATLQRLLGKAPDEDWSEEETGRFTTAYHAFLRAYRASGGEKLHVTVADALLSYLQIYGYQSLFSDPEGQIRKSIGKMWEELKLGQEEQTIEVKSVPGSEKKQNLLSKVLPTPSPAPLKVAFLYDGTPEGSGWIYEHERGRQYVQRVFADRIETTPYFNAMRIDPLALLEDAVAQGTKLIFTTSPRLLQPSLRIAVDHPDVVIMNCSLNTAHRYIRSYYARMYEAKFIIGAMAGSLSHTDDLGYLCDYPIFGQIAGINAFALGAQMVNPRARVHLEWSSVKGGKLAIQELLDRGVQLISTQDTAKLTFGSRSSFGLSHYDTGIPTLLAWPVWRWGVYYEAILRRMMDKTVQEEYEASNRALNYYWGMSAGVVDLRYSAALPRGTRRLAEYLKGSIIRGDCNPFLAPLHTQLGRLMGENQQALTLEQIVNMDYLVDNVDGSIPTYEELGPMGKATVDSMGVEDALKRGTV